MEELFEQPEMDISRIIKSDTIDNPILFVILDVNELSKINFNEVFDKNDEELRYSLDGNKTFIKFRGVSPSCFNDITSKSEILTINEINEIMHSSEWNNETNN